MALTLGMRRWEPEPPGDNRPTLVRWPRWRLLLDRPSPVSVLVVGEVDADVELWLEDLAVPVRWVDAGRSSIHPAELVIVGDDAARAFEDRHCLGWLARSCTALGAAFLPWPPSGHRDRALAGAGFGQRRWRADVEEPAGRWGRSRRGVVAVHRGPEGRSPDWLVGLGAKVGVPGARWQLSTPGTYPSQKAVARTGSEPGGRGVVVKLAQDPRFSDRLRNEARALVAVATADPSFAARRTPTVLAQDEVGGTAAVVEDALPGVPFLRASSLRADCALAADAAVAVVELAGVGRAEVAGSAIAGPLDDLLDRFVTAVRPGSEVAGLLAEQVAVVAGRVTVPAVVVHGDLGPWNLLVVDGRVHILDWESAAADGPPLWDLAYLARSYAVRCGRRRGLTRDRAIERHLVTGSPLTTTLAGWFADYRDLVGLDPELGEALFHTCWMHRAVKEAARISSGPGHYGPLCARLLRRRRSEGLRQLLGT